MDGPGITKHLITGEGLRQAWAELLCRYKWDVFGTLTFRHSRHDPFSVVDAFKAWLFRWQEAEAAERGLVGRQEVPRPGRDGLGRPLPPRVKRWGAWWRSWKRGDRPIWVVGVEPHESGNLHLHCLVKSSHCLPNMQRKTGWQLWYDQNGRGRIEPPRSMEDVNMYVAKYVVKGGELVLSDTFSAEGMRAATVRPTWFPGATLLRGSAPADVIGAGQASGQVAATA